METGNCEIAKQGWGLKNGQNMEKQGGRLINRKGIEKNKAVIEKQDGTSNRTDQCSTVAKQGVRMEYMTEKSFTSWGSLRYKCFIVRCTIKDDAQLANSII